MYFQPVRVVHPSQQPLCMVLCSAFSQA